MAEKDTSNRGFGSMDPEKQREIAREGGRASHEKGSHGGYSMEQENDRSSRHGGSHARSTRGGTSEQHAEAGRQSNKNAGQSDDRPDDHDQQDDRDSRHGGSHTQGTRGGSSETAC